MKNNIFVLIVLGLFALVLVSCSPAGIMAPSTLYSEAEPTSTATETLTPAIDVVTSDSISITDNSSEVTQGQLAVIPLLGIDAATNNAEALLNKEIDNWKIENPSKNIIDIDVLYVFRVSSVIIKTILIYYN